MKSFKAKRSAVDLLYLDEKYTELIGIRVDDGAILMLEMMEENFDRGLYDKKIEDNQAMPEELKDEYRDALLNKKLDGFRKLIKETNTIITLTLDGVSLTQFKEQDAAALFVELGDRTGIINIEGFTQDFSIDELRQDLDYIYIYVDHLIGNILTPDPQVVPTKDKTEFKFRYKRKTWTISIEDLGGNDVRLIADFLRKLFPKKVSYKSKRKKLMKDPMS